MRRLALNLLPAITLTIFTVALSNLFDADLISKRAEINPYFKQAKALSKFAPIKKTGRSPASFEGMKGLSVVIPYGEVAYLDQSTNIDTLTVYGTLLCDEDNADPVVELKVKTIYIHGTFQCGTSSNTYDKKMIISLKENNVNPTQDPSYRGIIVMDEGSLILNGNRKRVGWTKLGATAYPGQDYIIIQNKKLVQTTRSRTKDLISAQIQNKFLVGDKVVIGPTGFDYSEAESFTITSIDPLNPYKLYIDGTIQHQHYGQKQFFSSRIKGNILLDERAEVANLTRNILIRSDESNGLIDETNAPTAERGGHIMVHHGGFAAIDSVELYKMGQAGIMARYPFHWHHVMDGSGQFVRNSSIHHSFQRCITIHRTNNILLQNNVCYKFKGHGYFLEDGSEVKNKIIKNLAISARAPHINKVLLASDNIQTSESQGRFPSVSGFWISNPDNFVISNIVSGSIGTGFWMSFEKEVRGSSGAIIATPLTTDTYKFSYNTAHACKTGFTWDGAANGALTNNPNNPNDRKLGSAHYDPDNIPTFRGLKAFKNYMTGIYFRGQSAIYKDNLVAENGWSFWHAYNQIIRDTILIGKTSNTTQEMQDFFFNQTRKSRYRKTGMVLYDGPFEIHRSDFLNFSTNHETYTLANGVVENSTVVPFTSTGGSNKFTNIVSDLYFSPEPYHRAHIHGENDYYKDRQILGNAIIRDLDGSFTDSVPGVVIGKRSLGFTPGSGCISGGEKFKNFKVCSSNHTEGSLTFMRWGSPSASPWGTPFIVKRSDNKFSYPKSEWGLLSATPNNLFATANSNSYSYELLPKYPYTTDQNIGAVAKLDANTESTNPVIPIVKILAYGNNCHLGLDAIESNSLAELRNQTTTSWYSRDDHFYVRVIPKDTWKMITIDPETSARDLRTIGRYPITCDNTSVTKRIVGKIEQVSYGQSTTTLTGFACNYTDNSSISVKLYAYGPPLLATGTTSTRIATSYKTHTFLAQSSSNLSSSEEIAFKCGKISTGGRSFSLTLNNSDLQRYTQHKFTVKGISNSGGANSFISNSYLYDVIPKREVYDIKR
ncbi:MAG: hypothetical protein KC493_07420 [Bacteriovoracaceae bacterium]|nr:hypothetical protein [Bacteriovoracaceae bacterium]